MKGRILLGVDLVEIKKAFSFYEAHRDCLKDIFHPDEITYIRRSNNPGAACAMILAAKEAVFKAFAFPWMGRQGFRAIRIIPKNRGGLSFRLEGRFRALSPAHPKLQLFYHRHRDYVVAQCLPCALSLCVGN